MMAARGGRREGLQSLQRRLGIGAAEALKLQAEAVVDPMRQMCMSEICQFAGPHEVTECCPTDLEDAAYQRGLATAADRPTPEFNEWVFVHEVGEWRCHCGQVATSWDQFVAHFNAPPRVSGRTPHE